MKGGRLRTRITVKERSDSADSFGQPIASWSTLCTRWAFVTPAQGGERYASQQEVSELKYDIRVRADSETETITPLMRVEFNSEVLEIQNVINLYDRDIEIQLLCRSYSGR